MKSQIANPNKIMKTQIMNRQFTACLAVISLFITTLAFADGIPEPGLVMYGAVNNTSNNARITSGKLIWTVTPTAGGSSVLVTNNLADVVGQYSYILRVPFETIVGSATPAVNTLRLNTANTSYTRTTVSVLYNGTNYPATIQAPALNTFNFNTTARGLFEFVNLSVNIPNYPSASTDNPNADSDGDGMTNGQEAIAGTNPNDANSVFEFTSVRQIAPGVIELKWSSVSNKAYAVLRSSQLTANPTTYAVIRSNITATAPTNTALDTNAPANAINFYRLRVN